MSLRANDAYGQDQYKRETGGCGGAAVWSDRPHVVDIASGYASASHEESCVCHFAGPGWKERLSTFASGLSQEELGSCYVSEYEHVALCNPWNSLPLDQAISMHRFDWFPTALAERLVTAHLQPIYCLRSKNVRGFEALARASVFGKDRSGAELVTAATAHGMTSEFDRTARRAAVKVAATELANEEHLFLNVLPSTIQDPENDLGQLWDECDSLGLDPSRIVIELVESETLPQGQLMAETADGIRSRKAKLALDDFGAGFGTIAWIDAVKPDIVKFDRKLLAGEPSSERSALLSGLLQYVHAAGASAVAEGIETKTQLETAVELGFDLAQGWLLGHPAPKAERKSIG